MGTSKEIITMDMYRRMLEYKAGGRLRATGTGKYGMLSRDEDDCREPLLFENDDPAAAGWSSNCMIDPSALMCGCLAEDTMILMGDGIWKRICDIRIGDRIMQPDDGLPILVQNVWRGREKELIKIWTLDGVFVEMTEEHPVRQESGFIRAGELKPGDTVYGEEDRTMTVVSVRKESYNGSVYNLDLQRDGRNVGNGYFLANGIAVGDNRMQNGL